MRSGHSHYVEKRPFTEGGYLLIYPNVVLFRKVSPTFTTTANVIGTNYREIIPRHGDEIVRTDEDALRNEWYIEESFFTPLPRDPFPLTNVYYESIMCGSGAGGQLIASKYCEGNTTQKLMKITPKHANYAYHSAAMYEMPPALRNNFNLEPKMMQIFAESRFAAHAHSPMLADPKKNVDEVRNGFAYMNVGYAGWFHLISVRRADNKLCAITSSRDDGDYIKTVENNYSIGYDNLTIPYDLAKYFDDMLGAKGPFKYPSRAAYSDVDIITVR